MSLPVILQREAEDQIVASARWWAEHRSVEQSERWFVGIIKAIDSLDKKASQYPLARENEHFPYELRQMNFGLGNRSTHRVLFAIRPDSVSVLTVRHAAQDEITPGDL
jgi:plasmid stabilization system protein ParE